MIILKLITIVNQLITKLRLDLVNSFGKLIKLSLYFLHLKNDIKSIEFFFFSVDKFIYFEIFN